MLPPAQSHTTNKLHLDSTLRMNLFAHQQHDTAYLRHSTSVRSYRRENKSRLGILHARAGPSFQAIMRMGKFLHQSTDIACQMWPKVRAPL